MVAASTGTVIAFEGIDGSGKSTQVQRAAEWIARRRPERGDPVLLREPGGTPMGEAIRTVLLEGPPRDARTEMLLYMAARSELYSEVVLPALQQGRTVLLDRCHYSTAAYQGGGGAVPRDEIEALALIVTRGRLPDRVVLFDLPEELAARRRNARRAADRIEEREADYFRRVAEAYRALAREQPQRWKIVDARPAPDAVFEALQGALSDVV